MARVAFLGGTGALGVGLAVRFAAAGQHVVIGSRWRERAEQAAHRVRERQDLLAQHATIDGTDNSSAARDADLIVLSVPFEALEPLLADLAPVLAGKTILDVINPLLSEHGRFRLIPLVAGSVGALIQTLLPTAHVVSGFKHISARHLWQAKRNLDGDVLLCSDVPAAKAMVSDIVAAIPNLRGIDAGPLANTRCLESIAELLLSLNQQHHARTSIRILGI